LELATLGSVLTIKESGIDVPQTQTGRPASQDPANLPLEARNEIIHVEVEVTWLLR
jgi:hypothetical protein